MNKRLDSARARRLAVTANADPRTVMKELKQPGSVPGMTGERIRKALGLKEELPPIPEPERVTPTQTITVPADFVIYRCKISSSVIELPLPPKLSALDVGRLHAFLLSQVDDEGR